MSCEKPIEEPYEEYVQVRKSEIHSIDRKEYDLETESNSHDMVIDLSREGFDDFKPFGTNTIINSALSLLSKSPTANALVTEALKEGWTISFDSLNGPDFHLDVPEKKIILAQTGTQHVSPMMVVGLSRALRDVWQEKRNGAFDEDYKPESILTLERVRAADLDVISVLIAWELRCEGYNHVWRYILGSDESDLAMRFSAILERDPSAAFTHKALSATFKQWFRNEERVSVCDHETLNYMDDILVESEIKNPFGKASVQKIDIERLSCLPDKTAYLQHDAISVITDPLYAGMDDEINQSHLMHILYDVSVTLVQGVPFRNFDLAERIFPDGMMTLEQSETVH